MTGHESDRRLIRAVRERARRRYPGLPGSERERLTRAAARAVSDRGTEHEDDRVVAAQVALARIGSGRFGELGTERTLELTPRLAPAEPAELALAEHLHAQLEPEELIVVALLATCGVRRRRAAAALNLTVSELRELERRAREEAERHVLGHHDELICEPAELVDAGSPERVSAAVRGHLRRCRSCRREFRDRVWLVLGHAGRLELPLPPLVTSGSPWRRLRGARRNRRSAPAPNRVAGQPRPPSG